MVRTMHATVAHGEVVALDQQEAEIAREIGLLEIGLAERARASAGRCAARRGGRAAQPGAKGLEEGREALDVHFVVEARQGAREHEAVLERIARAGRRLRAVAEHPPASVGAAAEIGGVEMKMAPAAAASRPRADAGNSRFR